MSFLADYFSFDGHLCTEFGLMLGYIGQGGDDTSKFASGPTIVDKQPNRLWRPYFYGVTRPDKLTFQIQLVMTPCVTVNGVTTEREPNAYLTRSEIEAVTRWLTSPNGYRWMEILQPDMYNQSARIKPIYRYRCMITELSLNFIGDKPCGFTATVTCDSPYAYKPQQVFTKTVAARSSETLTITNPSTMEQLYYPYISIDYDHSAGDLTISNTTTDQSMTLTGFPATVRQIYIDTERRVLEANINVNLYAYFNFVFLGLARGDNTISITNGSWGSTIEVGFTCDFPVDIGG